MILMLLFVVSLVAPLHLTPLSANHVSCVKAQSVLKVGLDINYPPHEWAVWNNETQSWDVYGFNMEIIREIAKRMDRTIEFYPMYWYQAVESLKNGSIDLLFMAFDTERLEFFDFSDSILDIKLAIFIQQNKDVHSLYDLANHTVAVEKDDISKIILSELVPNAITVEVDTQEHGLEMVHEGDVYAFFGNYHTGLYFIQQNNYNGDIKIAEELIPIGNRAIAVKKGNIELRNELNYYINQIKLDLTYNKIYSKWFSEKYSIISKQVFYISGGIIAFLILLAAAIFVWNRLLAKKVSERTEALTKSNADIKLMTDIVSNDIGNIFHEMLNTIEILDITHFDDQSLSESLALKNNITAIFLKYKMAQEFIELLTADNSLKKQNIVTLLYERYVFSQFLYNLEGKICVILEQDIDKDIYVLVPKEFETVLDYLIYQAQIQYESERPITIYIYKTNENLLTIEFPLKNIDFLKLGYTRSIEHEQSKISLEYLFLRQVLEIMEGAVIPNSESLVITVPIYKERKLQL